MTIEDNYISLAGEVIRMALRDLGERWLDTVTGRKWCGLGGLNVDAVRRMYQKDGVRWGRQRIKEER